jgi:hypothetical protein
MKILKQPANLIASAVFAIVTLTISTSAFAMKPMPLPKVMFIEPKDGATVAQKFKVKMDLNDSNFTIGPIGDMAKNKGHHHIIVDGVAIPEGQPVPTDATHIHFGKGQTETELELKPGKHRLTLQFANGAHLAYDPRSFAHTIEVTVK